MSTIGPIHQTTTIFDDEITNLTYLYTDVIGPYQVNQLSFYFEAVLGAGVSSVDFVIESCEEPNGSFSVFPYFADTLGAVDAFGYYKVPVYPRAFSIVGDYAVGPINVTNTKMFWRIGYKNTGAGTSAIVIKSSTSVV